MIAKIIHIVAVVLLFTSQVMLAKEKARVPDVCALAEDMCHSQGLVLDRETADYYSLEILAGWIACYHLTNTVTKKDKDKYVATINRFSAKMDEHKNRKFYHSAILKNTYFAILSMVSPPKDRKKSDDELTAYYIQMAIAQSKDFLASLLSPKRIDDANAYVYADLIRKSALCLSLLKKTPYATMPIYDNKNADNLNRVQIDCNNNLMHAQIEMERCGWFHSDELKEACSNL